MPLIIHLIWLSDSWFVNIKTTNWHVKCEPHCVTPIKIGQPLSNLGILKAYNFRINMLFITLENHFNHVKCVSLHICGDWYCAFGGALDIFTVTRFRLDFLHLNAIIKSNAMVILLLIADAKNAHLTNNIIIKIFYVFFFIMRLLYLRWLLLAAQHS